MENIEELSIVTEVGVFGELNIEDPTKKKVKEKEMEALIESVNAENLRNL